LKTKAKEYGNRPLTGIFKQNAVETPVNKRVFTFRRRFPVIELFNQHML
jgi:hypothetical protein